MDPASGNGTATTPGDRVLPGTVQASVTDARAVTTAFALDRFGAPTLIEEPLGRRTAIENTSRARSCTSRS